MLEHIIEKFENDLKQRNIFYTTLEVDNIKFDYYFPEKSICFYIVDELENNEQTRDKKYFLNLRQKFREQNINLLIVYRSQLAAKYDIFFSRLMYKLNSNITKIYARKCEVKEMSYKDFKEFCVKYHSMGTIVSKIRIGIYYNGELLAVTCFNKPRYNNEYEYELGRYAVKFGYSIPGNFSKMMNYFIKKYKPNSVFTYHDAIFGENSVYEQAGFLKLEDSPPGFLWYRNGKNYNRRGWWKGMLPKKLEKFDPSLTAHENMRTNGYRKIWDLGQSRYGMKF